MRALILAAGKGSRLGPATARRNKCLLDLGGRPIIDVAVASLATIPEIIEIVVVIGHGGKDVVRHFREHPANTRVAFVRQPHQRGLVDAIECARPRVDDDDVLLMLGDELLVAPRYRQFIDDFHANDFYASVGSMPTSDPSQIRRTYTFDYDDRRVRHLIEKPSFMLSPHMGTGSVLFKAGALSYADSTEQHPVRGEKELVGMLQTMIGDGRTVGWFDVCDEFVNVNTAEDLFGARALSDRDKALVKAI